MQDNQQSSKNKFDPRLRRLAYVLMVLVIIATVWYIIEKKDNVVPDHSEEQVEEKLASEIDKNLVLSEESKETELPAARTLEFRQQQFDVFVFNSQKHVLHLFHKDDEEKPYLRFDRVENLLKEKNEEIVLLTNAGIFNEDYSPTGMLITPEQTYQKLNLQDGNGNFYLKPNGVFYQLQDGRFFIQKTDDFDQPIEEMRLATQSGPMLVINDSIHPAFNEGSSNLNIRSGVGINARGEAVFAISQQEVNFYDFARMFRDELSCSNALYLDGFISEMHLPNLKRDALGTTRLFSGIFAITTKK